MVVRHVIRRLGHLSFRVDKEVFWSKKPGPNGWTKVGRQETLATQASQTVYSLGVFVLQPERKEDEK